jgi:LPS-assembly lipoprotein
VSPGRTTQSRRSLVLGLCAALGACGFRPLLRETERADVREQLAAVEIVGLGGRLGQLVRNALLDELNPQALQVPPRYRLAVRLQRRADALAIQLDNTISRYNLTLTARFQLLNGEQDAVLYDGTARRIASYNVRRAPYATLVAELDAERRAAREIANEIRTVLAVQFARAPGVA